MRQSFDNQRYPHVIGECMTDKFARVDVDDRGRECLMVCVWVPNLHEEMDQNDYCGTTRSG